MGDTKHPPSRCNRTSAQTQRDCGGTRPAQVQDRQGPSHEGEMDMGIHL